MADKKIREKEDQVEQDLKLEEGQPEGIENKEEVSEVTIESKRVENKASKKVKTLIMGILFIIMLGLIGAIIALSNGKNELLSFIPSGAPEETNIYYDALKKYEDEKYYENGEEYNFYAYKISGLDELVVAVDHIVNHEYRLTTIYYVKNNKVVEKAYNHESQIIPLFNTDKEIYGYWLIEKNNGKHIYTLLDDIVKESTTPYKQTFNENSSTAHISTIDEHFISYSNSASATSIDKRNYKKLKRELKSVLKYADTAEKVADEREKATIKEKLKTIRYQQKEAKAKVEAEAKAKAEVETIKVGSHKLKLGTYTGKMQNMDGSYSNVKVVLKKNKIRVDGKDESYSIRGKFIIVYGFELFQVDKDNQMVYLAGECPTLKYKG